MAVLKCKMCGGDLEVKEGKSTCECEYCGSVQTIPKLDDEKKLKLFARANRLRLACEFDKAESIYESIVSEFDEEAEAYWGLVLCKYGIEYVDDPLTAKKIPTCHRSSFESVMDDEDFEQALENADPAARAVYRDEAKAIEELRKNIIEVSQTEKPYDIFICYKESDDSGARTIDSEIAQDVYDTLTDKGYRVFFSRISLEDKIGQEYEPYIFAALNSAKIMLAFGTDYEYYNAVWVKNEWSRYLKLMAKDKTKHLIPCYKNLDAYDIPKEFAKLQAQDIGKIGAEQDLLRGIEKLIGSKKEEKSKIAPQSVAIQQNTLNAKNLADRGFMSLEEASWDDADSFFERALDIDSSCAEAYLGKSMIDFKVKAKSQLIEFIIEIQEDKNFKRALQFADTDLKSQLEKMKAAKEETIEKEREEQLKELKIAREKIEPFQKFISAGVNHTVGLKSDGTVIGLGFGGFGKCDVQSWRDIAAVSAGIRHTVGLKSDGTVVATGSNESGRCNVSDWKDIVAVNSGYYHTVGLKSDGRVVAVGDNREGQCDVSDWRDIAAVSAGIRHTVGLKSDGTVVTVGDDGGQCGVSDWRDIVSVSGWCYRTVGLKSDGTVVTVGDDGGQCDVSDWKDIVAVSAGGGHTVGLKSNGSVIAVGDNNNGQCNVSDWRDIIAVSAGSNYTVGLKSDGRVVAVGDNSRGQCDVSDWNLFKNVGSSQNEINKQRQASWRSQGVCQHCGGEFRGMFSKRCSKCGRPKDY